MNQIYFEFCLLSFKHKKVSKQGVSNEFNGLNDKLCPQNELLFACKKQAFTTVAYCVQFCSTVQQNGLQAEKKKN